MEIWDFIYYLSYNYYQKNNFYLNKKMILQAYEGFWNKKGVSQDKKNLYIFGDNFMFKGNAGQACIRDLTNSFGIPTKNLPSRSKYAYLSDNDFEAYKKYLKDRLRELKKVVKDKNYEIVYISPRIGLGLAKMDTMAPKSYIYLMKKINKLLKN